MDLNELKALWIGDRVKWKNSSKSGLFHGIQDADKAKIMVDGKMMITSASEIEIVKEPEETGFELQDWLEEDHSKAKVSKTKIIAFQTEIDLHFNREHKSTLTPDQVLDWQLSKCREHIETAISKRLNRIIIIHGKGEGILRQLVHQMLDGYREVQWKVAVNQGGATEVIFYYH